MENLMYFKVSDMATVRNFEVIFYSCETYIDPNYWELHNNATNRYG
jgi:hypothetical protein